MIYSSLTIVCRMTQRLTCRLTHRVDRMEQSIGSIVAKIDTVLVKLDHMEKNKTKRKAAMSKILGTITEDDGSELLNLENIILIPK